MTNFQFYLNSPLRGRFILGPADGFFPKPFSAFYLLFIGLRVRQVWVFLGTAGARCCPRHRSIPALPPRASSAGFALSPGLIFPVLTKAEGWNNNFHHPK